MEDRFAQQLKKGVLEMLVLKLICEKPAYGYELLSELKKSSQGRFCLKEGTLYPILYRLEDDPLPMVNRGGAHGAEENSRSHGLWARGKSPPSARLAGI